MAPGPTVLDASAILAVLNREPGAERVAGRMQDAVVSSVNVTEVLTKLLHGGYALDVSVRALDALALSEVAFDADLARAAAELAATPDGRVLSLGDRACLALALQVGGTAVTTDRAWARLAGSIPIEFAR